MSSISFPHSPGFSHSSSERSTHDDHFFPASFDGSSSFQMNPLSSHPPRTPRTSLISSAHTYGSDIHGTVEEIQEKPLYIEPEDNIHHEDVHESATSKVRKEEVWKEIMKTSIGRDKALKLIQYSIRIFLLFHTFATTNVLLRKSTRPPWEIELLQRFQSTASGLSLARRCLTLFNWLTPISSILAPKPASFASESKYGTPKAPAKPLLHTFLHSPPPVLIDLANGVADDIYTFSRLGLISPRIGGRAGRIADWCWFTSTLIGLVELQVERNLVKTLMQNVETRLYADSLGGATSNSDSPGKKADEQELERLRRQDYWLQISRTKLLMDLIFVSYEVFRIKRARDATLAFSAFASGALSLAKLHDRHKNALSKALTY